MKRLISILAIILLSVVNVTAQEVWFECDVTKVSAQFNQKKTDLAEEGGYIFIPANKYKNNGSKGLLIYHYIFGNEYFAFETACQECKHFGNNGTIFMKTEIVCRCKTCGSEFQNISHGSAQQTNRSGEYWLKQYNCYLIGNKLIVTDQILMDRL